MRCAQAARQAKTVAARLLTDWLGSEESSQMDREDYSWSVSDEAKVTREIVRLRDRLDLAGESPLEPLDPGL